MCTLLDVLFDETGVRAKILLRNVIVLAATLYIVVSCHILYTCKITIATGYQPNCS
jgi:hypothetical protein